MRISIPICFALLLTVLAGQSAGPVGGESVTTVDAYTIPSNDVTLSFVRPGRVVDMPVKEGDKVKAGQIVAKQDDAEEAAILAVSAAQAKDETRIVANEKMRDLKEKTYKRKLESGVTTASELDEAKTDWEVYEANVALTRSEHAMDALKRDKDQASFDKTRVISPIDGTVEQTMIKVGESVDQQNLKIIRIVNIDPLWINVPVPFAAARELKENDSTSVKFSNGEIRTSKIIHVSTVADAASQTLLVRVEVENAAKTPAGEKVTVSFPKKSPTASTTK
ncbi:MAG: efflux RND transporter periplasmic adaptor subunit [Phycisphaerales bacterium]|nr:efflux RND transporter periplasmic adaptor subunit [Phycisphaerales bacterium]